MRIITYDGEDNIVSNIGESETPLKSIYTNAEFITKISATKLKQIKSSSTSDIEYWLYMVPMQNIIDLNDLPVWFTAGLQAMVAEMILTQIQVDTFLEI